MFRKALPALMIIMASGLAVTTASGTAVAATAPACPASTLIEIIHFAFKRPAITTGQSSTAALTAQNCTEQSQPAFVSWTAHFTGPDGGIPPGCPVIDPTGSAANFPPNTIFSASLSYPAFSPCTATQLIAAAEIFGKNGALLAQRTATLKIAAAAG